MNNSFIKEVLANRQRTQDDDRTPIAEGQRPCGIRQNNEQTPPTERQIILSSRKKLQVSNQMNDLKAFYTDRMSFKKWNNQRRRQYGRIVKNRPRKHISPLASYTFNKVRAQQVLGPIKDLGRTMFNRWGKLATEVGLKNKSGKLASEFNGAQVLVEWAKSEGYTMFQKTVKRVTWTKYPCGIAGYRSAAASELTKLKGDMVNSGEINIGSPICPITIQRHRAADGTVTAVETEHHGRYIKLKDIVLKHLKIIDHHGLLRSTHVEKMPAAELKRVLTDRKGKTQQHNYLPT